MAPNLAAAVRGARVGDLLPVDLRSPYRPRRIDATAVILPGPGRLGAYVAELDAATADFAAWDGRLLVLEPDGQPRHRIAIVDRYGQVYDVTDADDAAELPAAAALEEWFKFLATACPECGVIDDPIGRAWVP